MRKDFAGTLLRLRRQRAARAADASIRPVAFDFWDQVDQAGGAATRSRHCRLGALLLPADPDRSQTRHAAPMIVNQWVPAAHRGDAIGDSRQAVRDLLREMGHQSDLYAMTIDDDLRGDVRPFDRPGVAPAAT